MSAPAALNFDGVPGADGLSLRVYAGSPRAPKPLAIASGTLEILMFDGVIKAAEIEAASPLKVWSYPADRLAAHAQKTSIGVSYVFTPQWGEQKPRQTRVTVIARFVSPQGRRVYSAPAVVFVTSP